MEGMLGLISGPPVEEGMCGHVHELFGMTSNVRRAGVVRFISSALLIGCDSPVVVLWYEPLEMIGRYVVLRLCLLEGKVRYVAFRVYPSEVVVRYVVLRHGTGPVHDVLSFWYDSFGMVQQ
ncbi:hypothetical protein Tco_1203362 [Tanacetum coccineum]